MSMIMAESRKEMFLKDVFKESIFPIKLELLQELVSLNHGQYLDPGEIITVYGYGKQLILTGSSKTYENFALPEEDSESYVHMKPEKQVLIPVNCGEKLKDVHCNGKIFKSVEKLIADMPHFLESENDFFAMYVDEKKGMARIEKGQVLEFVRIVYAGNPGAYHNITKHSDKDRVIYRTNGEEIVLMGNIKSNLICVADPNEYSITSLLSEFSFPRKMQFVNPQLQEQLEQFTDTYSPLIQDYTTHERFFFAYNEKKSWMDVKNTIKCFENVSVLCIDEQKRGRVKVRVLSETSTENTDGHFQMLFAKETDIKDGGLTTFDLYGRLQKFSNENPESEEETEFNEKTYLTPISETGDEEPCLSRQDTDKKKNYETIYPLKAAADNNSTHNNTSAIQLDNSRQVVTGPSILPNTPNNPDTRSHRAKSHSLPTSSLQSTTQQPSDNHDQVYSVPGPHYKVNREQEEQTARYTEFPTIQRSKSVPVKSLHVKSVHAEQLKTIPKKNIDQHVTQDKNDVKTMEKHDVKTMEKHFDFSCDVKSMSVEQLCYCLATCGLPELSEVCRNKVIDGEYLTELNDDDLIDAPFFLKKFELKKLQKIKGGWRPKIE